MAEESQPDFFKKIIERKARRFCGRQPWKDTERSRKGPLKSLCARNCRRRKLIWLVGLNLRRNSCCVPRVRKIVLLGMQTSWNVDNGSGGMPYQTSLGTF